MTHLLAILTLASTPMASDLDRHLYPLAKPLPSPKVGIDVSDFPDGKPWAERAAKLAADWYPMVTSLLSTQAYRSGPVRIEVKRKIDAPAYASGRTITINGEWITKHPDDFGMVIHELVHVVQAYPGSPTTPGWLVEGIADYIRWWRFEPEAARPRIDKAKASYRDSYRTTAYFLAWASRSRHMGLVPALDAAMRAGKDPLPVFQEKAGKSVDELWSEFVASLP